MRSLVKKDNESDRRPARACLNTEMDALTIVPDKEHPDFHRVKRILEQTAVDWYRGNKPTELLREGSDQEYAYSDYYPSILEAVEYMPREQAIELFESTDLVELAEMQAFIARLRRVCPLYNLKELTELTADFISIQESSRDQIIRTGYQHGRVSPCTWLQDWLSPLYFVKLPLRRVEIANPVQEGKCVLELDYHWSRERSPSRAPIYCERKGTELIQVFPPRSDLPDDQATKYEDAPLMEGIDESMAWRLVSLRSELFDLKIKILQECARKIRQQDGRGMWDACAKILTGDLFFDDICFLHECDSTYSGLIKDPVGGLTEIIYAIGHFEEEAAIGQFARTRQALDELFDGKHLRLAVTSYYQLVQTAKEAVLKDAYTLFKSLQPKVDAFWDDYYRRVEATLETESLVTRTVAFEAKHAITYDDWIGGYIKASTYSLDTTGSMPGIDFQNPLIKPPGSPHVLRKGTDNWTIIYDSKPCVPIRNRKGLQYLEHLLLHPNEEFHVLRLVRLVELPDRRKTNPEYAGMTEEELAEEGLYLGYSEQEIMDLKIFGF